MNRYRTTRVIGNFGKFLSDGVDYYLIRNAEGMFQFCKKGDPMNDVIYGSEFCVIFGYTRRNWPTVMSPVYVSE